MRIPLLHRGAWSGNMRTRMVAVVLTCSLPGLLGATLKACMPNAPQIHTRYRPMELYPVAEDLLQSDPCFTDRAGLSNPLALRVNLSFYLDDILPDRFPLEGGGLHPLQTRPYEVRAGWLAYGYPIGSLRTWFVSAPTSYDPKRRDLWFYALGSQG